MNRKLLLALTAFAFTFVQLRAADATGEKEFQRHMKQVGKVAKDFKGNFDSKNAAAVEKDSTTAAEAYKAMGAFWKARKTDDATKWSEQSATAASAAAAAAKAGDWDKVKANWGAINRNCRDCHDAHREKVQGGGYKIK